MLKRKVLLILIVVFSNNLQAQNKIDSTFIPVVDSLETSLRRFYQIKSGAEKEEFRYENKFKFLRFLPSIGWDAFRMSPIISVNTGYLYTEINSARERKAKLLGIDKINEIQFNQDLVAVNFLISTLRRKVAYYNAQIDLLSLENQRFIIVQKSYDNHELTPSDYLTKQISYTEIQNSIKLLEVELYDLRNQIFIKAKQARWESLF